MRTEHLKEIMIRTGSGIPALLVRFRRRELVEIRFVRGGKRREAARGLTGEERVFFRRLKRDFSDYFRGRKADFSDYRVRPERGTEFQRRVWSVLREIPYGQMQTYKWVAEQIGDPNAARAVGNACGANPLPIVQPCHRVIASDGSLGGFSAGISLKRRLLDLEGISLQFSSHRKRKRLTG
jgi:O-6-methylguanine DNA methyltransferase